jgi:hypothetical protein
MPRYVIARQYLLPVYQRLVIEADTVEEACEKAIDHDVWEDAVEDGDGARATSINAVKRIPDNVNVADLDFDPQDPTSQNTYSLGRFLYEGDTSTIHSDVPVHFAETLDT